MGKTVPSYRMALEFEIEGWKFFRKALQSEEAREAFDWLMDICKNNAMASGAACNPVIFEPMVMSILLAQRKLLQSLSTSSTKCCGKKSAFRKTKKKRKANNKMEPNLGMT
jgi:hypothetical protein